MFLHVNFKKKKNENFFHTIYQLIFWHYSFRTEQTDIT